MMFRRNTWLIIFLLLLLSGGILRAQEPVDETLLMTFIPNIQFSPVYVAIEKGYTTEAGYNLSVEYLDEPDVANLVADQRYHFGVVSGEQVILARSEGRDIRFIYEWFQKYPVGIATPVDSGITSVAELAGRKVGIPGRFGASYSGLVALMMANDLTEEDIQLEPIGYTGADNICVGYETNYAQGVEATVVYINNEPAQMAQRCTEVNVFAVSDAVDMVSNGLITSVEYMQDAPDRVLAMVGAFNAGLVDTINNPAEAYLLSKAYIDGLPLSAELQVALEDAAAAQQEFLATNPDREAIAASHSALWTALSDQFDAATLIDFQVLLNTIDLWDADVLGMTDPASWEATQDVLLTTGFLTVPLVDLADAYTNDFLPAEMDSEG